MGGQLVPGPGAGEQEREKWGKAERPGAQKGWGGEEIQEREGPTQEFKEIPKSYPRDFLWKEETAGQQLYSQSRGHPGQTGTGTQGLQKGHL